MKKRLALFASGSGSNVQQICSYFSGHAHIEVVAVYCNNPEAFVIQRAEKLGLPCRLFTRNELKNGTVLEQLRSDGIDWIVLAGFLWLIPANLTEAYPSRILNIHPALLPAYGGKGMYGHHVHEAVIANKEKESGITIHLVDEVYDHGQPLFQAKTAVAPSDTPDDLAKKIHALEHRYYPEIIEKTVLA